MMPAAEAGRELRRTPYRRSSQNPQNANFAYTEFSEIGRLRRVEEPHQLSQKLEPFVVLKANRSMLRAEDRNLAQGGGFSMRKVVASEFVSLDGDVA
jgi:hypothetical protein